MAGGDGAPAGASTDGEAEQLIGALRGRLTEALEELAACRDLLVGHGLPHELSFSCRPEDHADVLASPAPIAAATGAATHGRDSPWAAPQEPSGSSHEDIDAAAEAAPATAAALEAAAAPPVVPAAGAGAAAAAGSCLSEPAGAEPAAARPQSSAGPALGSSPSAASGSAARPALKSQSRERERLEEELSMAKALLMLNNVTLNMDFDRDDEAEDASAAQIVNLKGSRRLIQLLITLKQKVSLLNQQYLLIRGDMLYLNHEMNVCRQWVLQSFRMAMQHEFREHSSFHTRFERLSKVLN